MGLVIKLPPQGRVTIGENIVVKNISTHSATILFEVPKDIKINWERLLNEKDKNAKLKHENV